jgi:hypothetical protein
MRKYFNISTALVFLLGWYGIGRGQSSANQTVTVQVAAINEIAVTGGNITLTINTATAGSEPDAASDNSSCDLLWTTTEASKKITVATDQASPTFDLMVKPKFVTGGTGVSGEVTLTTSAQDFVTDVATTTGSCDLQYNAVATASDGTGSEVHTVTYTLTDSA